MLQSGAYPTPGLLYLDQPGLAYTRRMQLRTARLCLDCEEIHDANQCPTCLSEAFVFLTRWVPVDERRRQRRPTAVKVVPEPSGAARWMRRGAFGLAAVAVGRWIWQSTTPDDKPGDPGR